MIQDVHDLMKCLALLRPLRCPWLHKERRWTTCLCHYSSIVCNWDYCRYLVQIGSHVVACVMGKPKLKVCVVLQKWVDLWGLFGHRISSF